MSLQPITVIGFDNRGGLQTNKKPAWIPETAFQTLENAYAWRDQVKKREGLELVGRLSRVFLDQSLGNSGSSPWTVNILASLGIADFITNITQANPGRVTSPAHNLTNGQKIIISNVVGMTQVNNQTFTVTIVDANNFTIGVDTTGYGAYISGGIWTLANEPNPELMPGSVTITIGAIVFTDNGNGTLSSVTPGNSGYINYTTGTAVITTTAGPGTASTASFAYYPSLPVMGIRSRVLALLNVEQTIFFDTKYAYIFNGTNFQEFIPGTTWAGTNSDFFWSTNYRGILPQTRLFFVTNFVNDAADPIRYTDGATWTNFSPA